MSVRKREWVNKDGVVKHAYVVDYFDGQGKRRLKTFKRKSVADDWAATTRVQVNKGVHVPESASITVKEAGDLWLARCRLDGLEPRTIVQYEQHLRIHIVPLIGNRKLVHVTVPLVRSFQEQLHEKGCSPQMVRGVVGSLGAIMADALERGLAAHNAVRELRRNRRAAKAQERHKDKLEVGRDIPTPDEVRRIVENAREGRYQTLLLTAAFTGLRASELRGLRWEDIDFKGKELHVRQRADADNRIGSPKSTAGRRNVPLPGYLVEQLQHWKLRQPIKAKKSGLVFPNDQGNVDSIGNIVKRGLHPACVRAGVVVPVIGEDGKQAFDETGDSIWIPKYTGMHCFRHFYASWCINREEDGGLGLPLKVVQEQLGHKSITLTADRYGHLFPRSKDRSALDKAASALLKVGDDD